MLKQETIDAFAKYAGIESSDLMTKIKSEGEEDVALREGQFFTNDELTTRDKNTKQIGYGEGKEAGVEMQVKGKKNELGYEFEGKDLNSLLDAHEAKIKSGFGKPNEKITELENDLKTVNATHVQDIADREAKYSAMEGKYNQTIIDTELVQLVPDNAILPKRDFMTLLKSEYDFIKEDGKMIVKRNGETLKDDKTATPLSPKDVIINWGTDKKYITKQGGRGGGNEYGEGNVSTKSVGAFNANWMKTHDNMNSPEYNSAYSTWSQKVGAEKVA